MEIKEFRDILFKKAKDMGFEDSEIYITSSESLYISIYKEEVDNYDLNKSFGLSFRGMLNKKIGYSYTRVLDENSIDLLLTNARNSALLIENEDIQFIYEGDKSYNKVKTYSEELEDINPSDLIELGLNIEKECKNLSKDLVNIGVLKVVNSKSTSEIYNTKGLNLKKHENMLYTIVYPIIEKNGKKYDGTGYKIATSLKQIDAKEIAKMGIDEAVSKIGSKTVKTDSYKIAIYNEVMSSLLGAFCDAFSADTAQKGKSLLKDKENTVIASNKVTIYDDPLLEDGLASSPFDDEGVATYKKEIVSNGELKTLLYNLKTAYKANTKSTGNGFKSQYNSPVSVMPSNFYIEKGDLSFDEILKTLDNGILITDISGIHAGANSITGDFSLAARGVYIKNGKKDYPIEQITIAGNFFDLLKEIKEVGNDLVFPLSSFGSPTVIVDGLSIAGK